MKPTVAIDMDGVLASWEGGTHETPGPPIPGAREFVSQIREWAWVVVYTCRCTPSLYPGTPPWRLIGAVSGWLRRHDIEVDGIWASPGKPAADAYIDDRAVECAPERFGDGGYEYAAAKANHLCTRGRLDRVFEDKANQAVAEKGPQP